MLVIEPKNEDNKKPLQAFVIPFALTLGGALLAGATFWGAFAMAALGALSFAIQAKAPDMPTFDYGFGSEHFSFGDRPNTDGAGTAIPVVYGKHKVSGHRIHTKIDTWNNTEHVSVLLALSEGEIESISDIKINDKPYTDIVPADCIETRMGTAGQSIIEGFEEIANWNEDVSHVMCTIAEVVPYQHVHIYTTLAPVNSVKVKFLITDLYEKRYYAWDTKQISPYYAAGGLKYKVEARITGVGAYTELQAYTTINRYVKGSSSIEESEELSLSSLGPVGLYDIKVTFDLILGSCGITWDKLECWTYSTANYPNVALLSIRYIPAPKVGGQIPEITCLVEGRKVDIWNGAAWVNQYSENPAWCLLDLLTNLRYGLGAWVEDETIDIDKDSFKAWGAYCDEQVDDQTGTSTDEDRHKIGIVLDVQKNAWEWMNIIAMTGRAFMIKSGSEYKVIPDQATAVSQLFTVGNIIEGSFKGSYISAKEDFNLIKVHFNNSETTEEYDRDIVQYPLALAPGVDEKPKEIQLYGITRASHAQREALYQYNIGLATTMVIEFDCAIDSLSAEIGDVIGVQHDVTLWGYGGRIVNAYNDGGFGVIEIDRDDLPNDGVSTYKVLMRLQDDTVIEKTVSSMANRLITFTTAFATVPTPRDTIYSYGTSTVFYKEFRIVSISLNIDLTRHISAIEYDADVYNLVAMTLPVRVESLLPNPFQPPASVTDLSLSIQDTLNSQRIRENRIEVFYNIPEFVPGAGYGLWDHANIYISAPQPWPAGGDGGWTKIGITNKIQFRTVRIEYPATYYIKVVSVSPNGAEEPFDTAPTASILVTDDTSIPLQSFTVFVDTAGNAQYTNIQDAIDALPAEGGIVHVMNGLYTESNILINKSNVQVQGSGGSTIIQSDGSADNIFNITALGAATIENISISNLTIDCLDLALSGIYVSGLTDLILVENFTFTDIIIKGAVDHNLWIEKDVYNGIIKGQFIDSLTGDGIHIGI